MVLKLKGVIVFKNKFSFFRRKKMFDNYKIKNNFLFLKIENRVLLKISFSYFKLF